MLIDQDEFDWSLQSRATETVDTGPWADHTTQPGERIQSATTTAIPSPICH